MATATLETRRSVQIIPDMPAAEYHARPEYSQSQFKLLPDYPELFYGFYVREPAETRWKLKPTIDMELGTQLHAVLLEREELLIIPPDVLTSNGHRRGKNWDAWCDEHPDNHGTLEKDAERIQSMIAGCRANPVVREILEAEGEVEQTILRVDPQTGFRLRHRLDKVARFPRGYMITDLKSTSIDPANERLVSAKLWELRYHQQAAAYIDAATEAFGQEPLRFVFIFVRNKVPYNACAYAYEPHDQDIELARRHNAMALVDLKDRLESGLWTGKGFGRLIPAHLPNYAYTDDPLVMPAPYSEFEEFNH